MSTIILMPLAIPNKPINYISSLNRRKYSKACFVSSIAHATPLVIRPSSLQCNANVCIDRNAIVRRTGNYKPPLWDFNYIQSLSSEYEEERYFKRASELIQQVEVMLMEEQELLMEPVQQLEFIDNLHRLRISYHFEDKINEILTSLYQNGSNYYQIDLYSTSLRFRLLRQHGFSISQDVFDCFKNERGDFKASLEENTKGLLQLYEASFFMTQGETTMELAREFATNLLQKKLNDHNDRINYDHDDDSDDALLMVRHALEIPLHWRVQRPNARWFIEESYGKRVDMNPILLELAKLDFNILQAIHQQELKHVSSWWEQTCLAKTLPFARDRVVENYMWTIGGLFEPQYEYSRIMGTKWADLCETFLQEAKWYSIGYTPTLEEYINTAWISISTPVILSHAFFLVTNQIDKEAVQSLYKYHNIVRRSAKILRLANDLGTSSDEMKRGDVTKSVECYMNETGADREEAQEYIRFLMSETWKKMNEEEQVEDSPFQQSFVRSAVDLGRMAQYMYQHGDGYGIQYPEMKDRISSLLFEPIA